MSNWEDTVMDNIALLAANKELPVKGGSRWQAMKLRKYHSLARIQAEISFKAGREDCAKTHFKPDWKIGAEHIKDATEEGIQVGRKEVVEWIEHRAEQCLSGQKFMEHITKDWKAFKKSRGIE